MVAPRSDPVSSHSSIHTSECAESSDFNQIRFGLFLVRPELFGRDYDQIVALLLKALEEAVFAANKATMIRHFTPCDNDNDYVIISV
jgi:hypothetical protein